jgi:hypothetical protein
VTLVVAIAVLGIAYAAWNATQPHVRLFVVNESAVAGSLRFGDGSAVSVPACSSARYSDDPTARWTLTSAARQLTSDTIGAISGNVVTVTIATDGTIATHVAMAIDTGVLSVAPPDVGPCASAAP